MVKRHFSPKLTDHYLGALLLFIRLALADARFTLMKSITVNDLLDMPVSDRLRLVEDLWDSIAEVPEAVALSEAYHWYNEKVPGLGSEFLAAAERTLDAIQENPAHYPIILQTVRRASLHRCPYGIFFVWDRERILVLAVMHAALRSS